MHCGSREAEFSNRRGGDNQRAAAAQSVLIVGAGCTGALVAACLRRVVDRRREGDSRLAPCVSVWEWGRGPAGRMTGFWADVAGEKALADVGAQVVSVRDPERLPEWLQSHLIPAAKSGLAKTDERQEGWHHFFAPSGMSSLQHASLKEAGLDELHFSRKVVALSPTDDKVGNKWRVGYAAGRGGRRPDGFQEFDVVVFAGTARDASSFEAVRASLPPAQRNALNAVVYDHRLCVALVMRPEMAPRVEELCEGRAEWAFEGGSGGVLSLIARQDAKGRQHIGKACVVVLHSSTDFAGENLRMAKQRNRSPSGLGKQALLAAFADLLGMPVRQVESMVVASKLVHWRQCQVRKPLPVSASKAVGCLVANGLGAPLILAGDYLAQKEVAGSFEGCLESAEAAACAVCDLLFGVEASAASSSSVPNDEEKMQQSASARVAGRWRAAQNASDSAASGPGPRSSMEEKQTTHNFAEKGKGNGKLSKDGQKGQPKGYGGNEGKGKGSRWKKKSLDGPAVADSDAAAGG